MAAGLGYKEFTTGDVLTAADANGYLASQVVMVFASAAARTSAIASPQEGMLSYLKDTNATEYYSGSAWVAVGAAGGGLTLLSTTTMNSGTTTQTVSSIPSGYKNLQILITQGKDAAGSAGWQIRFNGDSGTKYAYGYNGQNWTGGENGVALTTNVQLGIRTSSSSNGLKQSYAVINLYDYTNGGMTMGDWRALSHDGGAGDTYSMTQGIVAYSASAAITSFSVITGSTWSSGTIRIYGVN